MRMVILAVMLPFAVWAQFGPFERPAIIVDSNLTVNGSITLNGSTITVWPSGGSGSGLSTNQVNGLITSNQTVFLTQPTFWLGGMTISNSLVVTGSVTASTLSGIFIGTMGYDRVTNAPWTTAAALNLGDLSHSNSAQYSLQFDASGAAANVNHATNADYVTHVTNAIPFASSANSATSAVVATTAGLASNATTAANAVTATNALQLGGVAASQYWTNGATGNGSNLLINITGQGGLTNGASNVSLNGGTVATTSQAISNDAKTGLLLVSNAVSQSWIPAMMPDIRGTQATDDVNNISMIFTNGGFTLTPVNTNGVTATVTNGAVCFSLPSGNVDQSFCWIGNLGSYSNGSWTMTAVFDIGLMSANVGNVYDYFGLVMTEGTTNGVTHELIYQPRNANTTYLPNISAYHRTSPNGSATQDTALSGSNIRQVWSFAQMPALRVTFSRISASNGTYTYSYLAAKPGLPLMVWETSCTFTSYPPRGVGVSCDYYNGGPESFWLRSFQFSGGVLP